MAKSKKPSMFLSYAVAILWATAFAGILFLARAKALDKAQPPLIDPMVKSMNTSFLFVRPAYAKEEVKPTEKEVKDYLKTIFGKHSRVAWAVMQAECNYNRPEWPKCVNSSAVEHSVGEFQINIAKNGGAGKRVHWDKIPGNDLFEKEEWLSDWRNNILMAYKIFQDSGWFPWAGYTSNNYKYHL